MGKTFIAKRFIFTNSDHTDTTHIKKTFDSFNEALTWISKSHGPIAAGGSITDHETWNTLYEISRDRVHEDYRGHE